MYAIEVLPAGLREQSLSQRHVLLEAGLVPQAVGWLAALGWAITGWEARYRALDGELLDFGEPVRSSAWRRGEPWQAHVGRVAAACLAEICQRELRFAHAPLGSGPPLFIKLDAWPENPYLAAINMIILRHFPGMHRLSITEQTTHVPLLAALVRTSTRSFSAGQKVYLYDLHWGRNETALVVGRFRRKGRWICGHCPIASLDAFRPKVVQDPAVIRALLRQANVWRRQVAVGIFWRFLPLPVEQTD